MPWPGARAHGLVAGCRFAHGSRSIALPRDRLFPNRGFDLQLIQACPRTGSFVDVATTLQHP